MKKKKEGMRNWKNVYGMLIFYLLFLDYHLKKTSNPSIHQIKN